ncbi:NAD-dependent succinate-semialdehyde dehydrogenase [Shouchella clausii]|uniref:NAD-dependent succinate-semialdehyde dehydrogenase n=1 Tax=Shouchella clausii TaxID=79880 RepID=UPI00079A84B6|nr:NAD-dependent succinate-semialdehyde dehydrogenase [Shouchella clausii]KKI88111.1 succinate-semialdehyde dehydrogenase [Shouchella clausii]
MKLFINGEWVSEGLDVFDVVNPATGEVVGSVPKGGAKEAKVSADGAYEALPAWTARSAYERSAILEAWHDLIAEQKEELARLMTMEQGKPINEARGEIAYANSFIKWYAEEGKRIYGETIPASSPDKRLFVVKQPVGVVAAITPWNFPAAMITRKVAPALAVGCTVLIKPASQTPLTALKLAELAEKAGLPKGVLHVVVGSTSDISKAWQEDERVRKLTFTGSTEIGRTLMSEAGQTVKKISLELGGHAPVLVFEDADIDHAVQETIASKFRNGGQTCVCANRIYVHESIAQAFITKMKQAVEQLKVGNGLNEETDIGPLIDEDAVDKVLTHIRDAKDKGAKVLTGGSSRDGLFIEPTVIAGVTDDMACMSEETFGPLAPISTFKTEEEVVKRANDTIYGLAAYLFTTNLSRGIRVAEKLDYGVVGLNDGGPSVAQAPFGGFKQSGIGREGGHEGLEEFLESKYVSLKM